MEWAVGHRVGGACCGCRELCGFIRWVAGDHAEPFGFVYADGWSVVVLAEQVDRVFCCLSHVTGGVC